MNPRERLSPSRSSSVSSSGPLSNGSGSPGCNGQSRRPKGLSSCAAVSIWRMVAAPASVCGTDEMLNRVSSSNFGIVMLV